MPLHFFDDDDQRGTLDNIIYGKSDYWLQWYKDHCYPGSVNRKRLNIRRRNYYWNNRDRILETMRRTYSKTVIE